MISYITLLQITPTLVTPIVRGKEVESVTSKYNYDSVIFQCAWAPLNRVGVPLYITTLRYNDVEFNSSEEIVKAVLNMNALASYHILREPTIYE